MYNVLYLGVQENKQEDNNNKDDDNIDKICQR